MEKDSLEKKKRVLVVFGCFLAFMAVCTVITKGIYASQMAQVTVVKPEQRTITHDISMKGLVQPKQEFGVYVQEGLRVETVYVDAGAIVEEGTALFQVRPGDLEQRIAELEADIRCGEAVLKDEAGERNYERQEKQKSLTRMQEDYDSMVRELDIAVEKKRLAYETAKRVRELAEEKLASVSGGDAGSVENARLAERQAALEVEEALLNKEEAIREWEREYADTAQGSFAATEAGTVAQEEELEKRRAQLEALQTLYAAGGVVCAQKSAYVKENRLQTGEYTPDTACMLLVEKSARGVVEFTLDDDVLSWFSVGDVVDLEYKTSEGERKRQESAISYIGTKNGGYVARLGLSDSQLTLGQKVTLKYQYISENYAAVIPVQALMEENGSYYVYVVEEQQGFLGTEERIRKVQVAVTDSNLSSAAVESAVITAGSRIVLQTSKELADGDMVRVIK